MPSPLRPFDKLRHRVDWSALAPYVSNLTIQLDPCLDGTAGLKYVSARSSACRRHVCLGPSSHRLASRPCSCTLCYRPACRTCNLLDVHARIYRELVRQANGRKIRSVYPKYVVKSTFTDGGVPAQLAIEYGMCCSVVGRRCLACYLAPTHCVACVADHSSLQ